jgi:hypothetical protein
MTTPKSRPPTPRSHQRRRAGPVGEPREVKLYVRLRRAPTRHPVRAGPSCVATLRLGAVMDVGLRAERGRSENSDLGHAAEKTIEVE